MYKSVYQDLRPHAARVRAPTLLAWGARDHTIPIRCAHTLRGLIPGASLYVSRHGSHDWMIDRAPEFASVVRAFIDAAPLVTDAAVPYNRPPWLSASSG